MSFEDDIDLIDAYLDGKLEQHDRDAVEARLKTDQSFSEKFDRQKTIRHAISGMGALKLEAEFASNTMTPTRSLISRTWLGLAASITILVAIGTYWIFSPPQYQRAAERLYQTPVTQMDRGGASDRYTDAMISFARRSFAEAMEKFSGINEDHPNFLDAQYYRAHATYLKGDFQSARTQFLQLGQSDVKSIAERSTWFAVLAGIRAKMPKGEMEAEVKSIADAPTNFYRDLAKELLTSF